MTDKKKNIKQLTKDFWALSRQRQESFLKELYNLSSPNKALFQIRLGQDDKRVLKTLIADMRQQTVGRSGKFKKLRLSKINEILRHAEKYALHIHQQIELKRVTAFGMIDFVLSRSYMPDRYQVAAARHLDEYLSMVKMHILERSEQEEIYAREQALLLNILSSGCYIPRVEDVYMKHFV